jgi:hypothetical protein
MKIIFGCGLVRRLVSGVWLWWLPQVASRCSLALGAAQGDDGVCAVDGPVHAGLLEALADDGLTGDGGSGTSLRPARSSSSLAALANGTAAAALLVIAASPGDMEAPVTPGSASRGASPCLHRAQWYRARRRVTGPSAVSMTLSR